MQKILNKKVSYVTFEGTIYQMHPALSIKYIHIETGQFHRQMCKSAILFKILHEKIRHTNSLLFLS